MVRVETSAKLNGAPITAGLAWLGGFGDLTVTNPAPIDTVSTFYSENGKLTTFAAKKLEGPEKWATRGLAGRQRLDGHRGPLFHGGVSATSGAAPGTLETRYWKVFRTVQVEGKEAQEPVPQVATATSDSADGFARLCRAKRLRRFEEDEPAAARAGEFRLARIHRRPAVSRAEVAARLHSQLGLGHRCPDAGHQHAAFSAAHFQLSRPR